ncbi:MAG: cytochrome c oxidase subunit II [Dehalococcoidia bacterium]
MAFALLLSFLFLLVGCDVDTPQNTFAPEGDVARKQRDSFNLALWPAIAIFVIVEGGLIFALIRFRQKRGQDLPKQVHGNLRLEVAWTIAPAILLLALAVPMLDGVIDLARDPSEGALRVKVMGQRFDWSFEYPDLKDAGGEPLFVPGACQAGMCGELHIPVGREIGASLESADVIHSFWVPKLAGKLDVVPGRTNSFFFNAITPGTYSGQCAEFCGEGHAEMRLTVIAESEAEFQAWVDEQLEKQQAAKSGPGEMELARQRE